MATERRKRGAAQADKVALDAIADIIDAEVTATTLRDIDAAYREAFERIVDIVAETGRL